MAQVVMPPSRRKFSRRSEERLRTQRVVNLRLLLVSALLATTASVFGFVWYRYRSSQVGQAFEIRATALEQEGRWREAADYLRRYRQLEPGNLDARVRLIQLQERFAASAAQRRQLIGLLNETLGLLPKRDDLRLKLANQLLESGDYSAAEAEARKLLSSENDGEQQAAQRIIALSLHRRARPGGPVSIEQAATALAAASAENSADVTLASLLAVLYREFPQNVGMSDSASQADEIMTRMVDADPNNDEALIARYIYRRRYAVKEDVRHDLDVVLARNPNHVQALLLAASEDASVGGQENLYAAEQKLQQVIELAPQDPRGHIGLARLYSFQNKPDQSLKVLQRGRAQLDAPSIELNGLLADMLVTANRLDDAEKVIGVIADEFLRLQPDLTADGRTRIENFLRLIRARVSIARNDYGRAVRGLNEIIASVGQADATAGAAERLHAYAMLASLMTKLGRPDMAAAYWKAVVEQAPNNPEARRNAATAYLELGRPAEAISQLESYLQLPSASPEAWIALVQAHLQQQTRLPSEQRNWSEFLTVLEQAKTQLPNRWELTLADVFYRRALGTDVAKRQAVKQLQDLERTNANDRAVLAGLVTAYQHLDAPTDAERVLARYNVLEPNKSRRAMLQTLLLVGQGRAEEASKLLETAVVEASSDERLELQVTRVKLLMAARQMDAAQQLVADVIAATPANRELLILGFEIALARQDFSSIARWEDKFKQLEMADDFDWRFYLACRLVSQYSELDPGKRMELQSLVESLRSERPEWFPVVALAGRHADLTGNRRQAIDAYRLAVELGEQRPEIFERLVAALYDEGRYSEATAYLTRLEAARPADGRIESLTIALAVKANRLQEALQAAKQAVDRGSSDPMHYVWLAHLLSLNGQQKEAETTYRKSIEHFPKDNRVWNALFTYLIRTKQPDRARRALQKWSESVAADTPVKHFILAQGYELLGELAAAKDEYRTVIAEDSKNAEARMRYARLLVSIDAVASRAQFEEILKADPGNGEARRYLAALLAASGDEQDWARAVGLLESGERSKMNGAAIADDRLRAILLSRRGRNRAERLKNCETARRILATRLAQDDETATDLDRLLLAGIYEQEAALRDDLTLAQAARDAMRPLVDRDNPSPDHLARYVQLLLRILDGRSDEHDESARDEELREVLTDDARRRIDELQAMLDKSSTAEDRFVPITLRIRLSVLEDNREEGSRILNEFAHEQLLVAADDTERAKLLLKLGNVAASAAYHQEAERWYRQLMTIAPNSYVLLAKSLVEQDKLDEAVKTCLKAASNRPSAEIATVLAQLLSSVPGNPRLDDRVNSLIDSALESDANNVALLTSVAVRRVMENNNDEAIRLFRRVLDLNPQHSLALNNLATLLAERPNQLSEARKYVERAIATAGRIPGLLDTLGTIMIRADQLAEAIPVLEEAVAGGVSDPRYYFHLAVAYQRSGRDEEARDAIKTAHKFGLNSAILTSGDRELRDSLNHELLTAGSQN